MANMKKPASKKVSNGSNTKPYNVKLMTPGELVGGKKPSPKKPPVKRPNVKPAPLPAKPKPKPKPRIVQMPSKISPSKMTPAQKAKYLQNPERYDK